MTYLNAFQLDPKPFKRVIAFRVSLLRKTKGYTLGSGMTPTRSEKKKKKKKIEACQPPNSSAEL